MKRFARAVIQRRVLPIDWGMALPAAVNASAAAEADAFWSGDRAMRDIMELVANVPRCPGTPGQLATVAYIESELARTSIFDVARQTIAVERPSDGEAISLINVIARFAPEKPARILVGTHHDSLARAVRDPVDPYGPMPGANNSGSGVAVLLETARVLATTRAPEQIGVDLVFFDGEEGYHALGAGEDRWVPLGSTEFVRRIGDFYDRPPVAVIIVDLVGAGDIRLRPEAASLHTGRDEAARLWRIGREVAPQVFSGRAMARSIGDDHSAFWRAGIPAVLMIDMRRPDWSDTTRDTPDKCRAASLAAVGRTITRYLHAAR